MAIARENVLLLHRSVDLQERTVTMATPQAGLPVVDAHDTAGEWAAQQPLPEHGRNPYADQVGDEAAVQGVDNITSMRVPDVYAAGEANVGASDLQPVAFSAEIAQAVSVASAYFEDTLSIVPTQVLSAGPLGADRLMQILLKSGIGNEAGLRVHELVERAALLQEAVRSSAPRPWLSGVLGALRG